MGSRQWGSGTDTFGIDYLDAQVPDSGSNQWQSSDINAHMLSALELKRMSGHFDAGINKTIASSTPEDTPLSLKQEGASSGYYRTIHYSSHNADGYFFSQNVLMWDRHIITNVSDIQRLVWKPTITEQTFTNASMVDGTTSNITCYSISQFENSKVDILKKGKNNEYTATDVSIIPAIISPDSPNHLQGFNYWGRVDEYATWVDSYLSRYNQTYGSNSDNTARYCPVFGNGSPIILPNSGGETSKWAIDDTGNYAVRFTYKAADQYSYLWTTYCNVKYWVCSEDELLHVLARSGMKFVYNNTMYKPVAENGVITGYTDDMTKESEWDNWHDYTDHEVPTTPPTPGPSDDDPWHGVDFGGTGAGGGGAFCSVYYMTGAELTSLKNWSNTSAPEKFDMLPSIIGLQQLPIALSGIPTTVKFLKSGAITSQGDSRVVDTEVPAGTGAGQPVSFSLGSIDINRRMQQRGEPYLDYDCSIELFLPFAGTFVLDTQAVMGRTINAEIVIDPVNGTAFAYAWVSQGGQKMPIAYGGGSIAVDLPIASNQWGISRAAFKQISHQMTMNAIKDVGEFILGLGVFKTGQSGAIVNRAGYASLDIKEGLQAKQIGGQMMTSSTINAATDTASSIVNAHQLNNTNYTAVNGSFGGSYAEWAQPFTAYVRITRPKFKKPSNFNHTQAVPCVEAKTLGSCSGLTVCVNPDCGTISCTEAEKIMITQALVGGVYAGGGGQ